MITYTKFNTYKRYVGIYEFCISGSWFLFDRLREREFVSIEEIMKEARMLQKNAVSPDVAEVIRSKIEESSISHIKIPRICLLLQFMMSSDKQLRVAILDLNNGQPNQGMRCIREILEWWGVENNCGIHYDEFDVRQQLQVPGLDYDAYISSGGPGSPLESEGTQWENNYFNWIHAVNEWNSSLYNYPKKNIFFICHSFQLACRYFKIANVCSRKSTAFGVFPVHMLEAGYDEPVFVGLKDPFYGVDSRDFQVINPNENLISAMGGHVLAIEKERPHVPYERAVMSIRFNENFIGTQFHPEADAVGMSMHLQKADKKKIVIENHGEPKWQSMIEQLNDPDKIMYTYKHILPNFLRLAVGEMVEG